MTQFADLSFSVGLSALAGVISHMVYFVRGEHHLYATSYIGIAAVSLITVFQLHLHTMPPQQAFIRTRAIAAVYVVALSISIIIYRMCFHPLRHFPGPRRMRISKIGHAFSSRRLDNHHQMDQLHQEYGDFVRTGPNELTISSPEAYHALHGPQSICTKAAWYDILKPSNSLHSTRIKAIHDNRRRVWEQAFSTKG